MSRKCDVMTRPVSFSCRTPIAASSCPGRKDWKPNMSFSMRQASTDKQESDALESDALEKERRVNSCSIVQHINWNDGHSRWPKKCCGWPALESLAHQCFTLHSRLAPRSFMSLCNYLCNVEYWQLQVLQSSIFCKHLISWILKNVLFVSNKI